MNNTQNNNQNYFRITGYDPQNDCSFILDSNGMFEKLWQFSAYLVEKGIEIKEVSKMENIIDINIAKLESNKDCILLRAIQDNHPEYILQNLNGITYKAVKVSDKIYIPDKNVIIKKD